MKKISVYLRNAVINPSGYYRLFQYFSKLSNLDVKIKYRECVNNSVYLQYHFGTGQIRRIKYVICIYYQTLINLIKDIIYKPDIIIVNREISPRYMPLLFSILFKTILRKSGRVIWDVDDLIFDGEISKRETQILTNYSDKIIVATPVLCEYIKQFYLGPIDVMHTTDGDYLFRHDNIDFRIETYRNQIRLLWIATASNICNVLSVIEELEDAAKNLRDRYDKELLLICICNKPVNYSPRFFKIENIVWNRNTALEYMKTAHVGIMPLIDNEFNGGKGGFKLIQYLSAGLPIIASPVGINKDIVKAEFGYLAKDGEWSNAVIDIGINQIKWISLSSAARQEWENAYSYETNFNLWKIILGV